VNNWLRLIIICDTIAASQEPFGTIEPLVLRG